MKKVILNLLVLGVVCFSNNALSQHSPINKSKSANERNVSKKEKSTRIELQNKSTQTIEEVKLDNAVQTAKGRTVEEVKPHPLLPSISIITTTPDRVNHKNGFLVQGTSGPNKKVEVYNKARWKQKGYSYERAKEYDPIMVTADNNGKWKAKMEQPYLSVPSTAYDIKFEISSKQFPYDRLATLPSPSIVYGTMAPPKIEQTDGSIHLSSNKGPGGQYPTTYTTISGKGIPNMDIKISVATEYQSPIKRYSSGDEDNLGTYLRNGETKTTKITANGTWSVKVKVPNPHSLNRSFGVRNFKLVIKATQSASSSDVSEEAEKKFSI
ncbi:hypothetical protein KCTC52924_03008 [Arenibacter antarcticus]|uniref:YD repeat-containing protein n=1 Tax=Arenibacter antarcticus TaxID=2040469 RepID=A0ABW5VHP4_9FLAO|nr:hypothetical protein [Arenibacter sp. H213]MCM4166093.1 hypothetical protein [Arenibacter sp. H213]